MSKDMFLKGRKIVILSAILLTLSLTPGASANVDAIHATSEPTEKPGISLEEAAQMPKGHPVPKDQWAALNISPLSLKTESEIEFVSGNKRIRLQTGRIETSTNDEKDLLGSFKDDLKETKSGNKIEWQKKWGFSENEADRLAEKTELLETEDQIDEAILDFVIKDMIKPKEDLNFHISELNNLNNDIRTPKSSIE